MVSALISRVVLLTFGTLYPAYRSYKAIKNKDVREYVKWMMYWVIFALFTAVETFADVFLAWLPLYYEIKIVFFIWLLSPATKGSSILYRKFVHPRLVKHEKAIDKYISQAQRNSYSLLMDAGRKGFSVAADTFVKTAVSGQYQLVETLKRYNSMQELRNANDETDANVDARRGTWYEGMPAYNADGVYDPENDVRFLQSQYKNTKTGDMITEETNVEINELQRSQSDIGLSNMQRYDSDDNLKVGEEFSPVPQRKELSSNDHRDKPADSIDYSYQYSSNTLPRTRKPKKPIHETMPVNRTTRRKTADRTKLN